MLGWLEECVMPLNGSDNSVAGRRQQQQQEQQQH